MTHIQQRRDESAIWTMNNPVLFDGEAGHEKDTGREKIGDGVTPWNDLPYKFGVDSVAGRTGEVTLTIADVSGAAPLDSPALTGSPTAPTPAIADNDVSIATTAFVQAQKDSPVFTGNPTAPTPAPADNDTTLATTAFVQAQKDSPVFTGNPTAPTPATTDDDTTIATTAFVKAVTARSRDESTATNLTFGAFCTNAGTSRMVRRGGVMFVNFDIAVSGGTVPPTGVIAVIPAQYRPAHPWRSNLATTSGAVIPILVNEVSGEVSVTVSVPASTVIGYISYPLP